MEYCSNCGTPVTDAARFCSHCANPLAPDASLATQAPDVEATPALGLDDVPWWLGWLAIPLPLLAPCLIIYPVCAYRRGRRDGVGREPTDEPYTNMTWKTLGWALPMAVPIFGWYALVHLMTLWYKHGLRIGARESLWMESGYTQQLAAEMMGVSQRKAPTAFTSLPAMGLVSGVALLAFAGLVAAVLAFPAESGAASSERIPAAASTPRPRAPTPRGPLLTGAEAAGKAESKLRDGAQQSGHDISRLRIICNAEDFNSRTSNWIVLCTFAWPTSSTDWRYYVNDRTGAVTEVR